MNRRRITRQAQVGDARRLMGITLAAEVNTVKKRRSGRRNPRTARRRYMSARHPLDTTTANTNQRKKKQENASTTTTAEKQGTTTATLAPTTGGNTTTAALLALLRWTSNSTMAIARRRAREKIGRAGVGSGRGRVETSGTDVDGRMIRATGNESGPANTMKQIGDVMGCEGPSSIRTWKWMAGKVTYESGRRCIMTKTLESQRCVTRSLSSLSMFLTLEFFREQELNQHPLFLVTIRQRKEKFSCHRLDSISVRDNIRKQHVDE